MDITRSLSAAGCCALYLVGQPDLHSLPVMLMRLYSSSLLPATTSMPSAATLPEKYPEGRKEPCCHFKGKERMDARVTVLLTHCLFPTCMHHLGTWP